MSMCGKHIGLQALRQASIKRVWSIAQNKYSTKVSTIVLCRSYRSMTLVFSNRSEFVANNDTESNNFENFRTFIM